MLDRILIPLDGSEFGKTAMDYGIYIARKFQSHLTGLHIVDVRLTRAACNDMTEFHDLNVVDPLLPMIEKRLEAKADAVLAEFLNRCRAAGTSSDVKKAFGIVGDVIIEEAARHDGIVLAKRGEHFKIDGPGGLAGSTVASVVRKSGKPVIVTPAKFKEIESIALAYDGSPPACHALNLSLKISEKAEWPLTVIVVTDDEKLSADLTGWLEADIEKFEGDGDRKIDSSIIVLKGSEDREIVKFIQDGSVELLAMGAYGHSRLREFVLGSTASHVIRKSNMPVMLVH